MFKKKENENAKMIFLKCRLNDQLFSKLKEERLIKTNKPIEEKDESQIVKTIEITQVLEYENGLIIQTLTEKYERRNGSERNFEETIERLWHSSSKAPEEWEKLKEKIEGVYKIMKEESKKLYAGIEQIKKENEARRKLNKKTDEE